MLVGVPKATKGGGQVEPGRERPADIHCAIVVDEERVRDALGKRRYFDDTADRLNGTRYTATFSDGSTASGIIAVGAESGYSVYDGHGLINASEAVSLVP